MAQSLFKVIDDLLIGENPIPWKYYSRCNPYIREDQLFSSDGAIRFIREYFSAGGKGASICLGLSNEKVIEQYSNRPNKERILSDEKWRAGIFWQLLFKEGGDGRAVARKAFDLPIPLRRGIFVCGIGAAELLPAEDLSVFAGSATGGIDLHLDADYIEGVAWRAGQCEEKRWDWVDFDGSDCGGVELLEAACDGLKVSQRGTPDVSVAIDGATTASYTPAENGIYLVDVTGGNLGYNYHAATEPWKYTTDGAVSMVVSPTITMHSNAITITNF